jgi:hypothetical protein
MKNAAGQLRGTGNRTTGHPAPVGMSVERLLREGEDDLDRRCWHVGRVSFEHLARHRQRTFKAFGSVDAELGQQP